MRAGFSDRTNDEFLQEVLTKVNELRAKHGSPPLTLDPELVEYAKSRAAFMAEKDDLTHEGLRSGTGENASKASASSGPAAASGTDAVEGWYAENSNYDYTTGKKIDPDPYKAIGHFTALVWKSTTKIGVGRVAGQSGQWWDTYIVANFSPPGNMGGQYVMNVVPAS
ncbi:CAP family protein [Micromonospora sp. DT44]|uniref:CAP family protein n=1 Tax=Micromonospora sp. DT44 TaxID=3393439 RepID=UPI003CF6E135